MSPGQQAAFTSEVFTNNIKVTLVAFAGGITFGLLTGLALIYNGVLLGVIGGLMSGSGNTVGFIDLVTAHGVLELSCILVAGAAGLRLGWALVDPGRLTRTASAVLEARNAVQIALGTAPWLILAGIIDEAAYSPDGAWLVFRDGAKGSVRGGRDSALAHPRRAHRRQPRTARGVRRGRRDRRRPDRRSDVLGTRRLARLDRS